MRAKHGLLAAAVVAVCLVGFCIDRIVGLSRILRGKTIGPPPPGPVQAAVAVAAEPVEQQREEQHAPGDEAAATLAGSRARDAATRGDHDENDGLPSGTEDRAFHVSHEHDNSNSGRSGDDDDGQPLLHHVTKDGGSDDAARSRDGSSSSSSSSSSNKEVGTTESNESSAPTSPSKRGVDPPPTVPHNNDHSESQQGEFVGKQAQVPLAEPHAGVLESVMSTYEDLSEEILVRSVRQ